MKMNGNGHLPNPMIGVSRLERALAVISASQSVKGGIGAISVNMIAPSDSGKTQLMLKAQPHGARVLNDVTMMTLNAIMREHKPPSYLVIPDFNVVISHKPTVAELTMAMLLALMGEGVTELNPGLSNEVKIRMTRAKAHGLRIGLITGMTPEMFNERRGKWRATGLLRRMVPLFYRYKRTTVNAIQSSIREGGDALAYLHERTRYVRPRGVIIPAPFDAQLEELSETVIDQLQWKAGERRSGQHLVKAVQYPFTPHKVLRQIASAAALLNGSGTVDAAALADTENVVTFMRYDRPEEI
jgi:hypothetical protein